MSHPKVDWAKAPEWAVAWAINTDTDVVALEGRYGVWLAFVVEADQVREFIGVRTERAPLFGYRGTVEKSLTLRAKD